MEYQSTNINQVRILLKTDYDNPHRNHSNGWNHRVGCYGHKTQNIFFQAQFRIKKDQNYYDPKARREIALKSVQGLDWQIVSFQFLII